MEHEKTEAIGTRTLHEQSRGGGRRPTAGRGAGVRVGQGAALCAAVTLAAVSPVFAQFGPGGPGQQAAAPAPTVTWTEEEFQAAVFGPDAAVDIIHWLDPNIPGNPNDDIPYVYMTGYHTTANGGTVFATYKYRARVDPSGNQFEAVALFPSIATVTPNERNKAVSLTLDNRTGEIYVTGQGGDPNSPTGLDYVTIKYDKDLGSDWVSTYNGPGNGDDVPVDIDFVAGESLGLGVVLVTGSSPRLLLNLDLDIATVGYNVGTGIPTTLWEDLGDGEGVRRYGGTGGGNDSAVGVTGVGILNVPEGEGSIEGLLELQAYVAGTALDSHGGGQFNNDIVALAYALDQNTGTTGVLLGLRLFDRNGGNDVATGLATYRNGQGISTISMSTLVTICGYTPSDDPGANVNDTDYVVLNYDVFPNGIGVNWLLDGWDVDVPSGEPARFFDGLASTEFSDDRALAIGRPSPIDGLPLDGRVWITGRVREADGVDYDIGTVVYDTFDLPAPVIDSWIEGIDKRSGGSDDRAVAIDVHGDVAYIGGWTSLSSVTMFFASKYEILSASSTWKIRFRNILGPDAGQGIVSVIDGITTPVFMTGKTTEVSTGENQFTVRIDQP